MNTQTALQVTDGIKFPKRIRQSFFRNFLVKTGLTKAYALMYRNVHNRTHLKPVNPKALLLQYD